MSISGLFKNRSIVGRLMLAVFFTALLFNGGCKKPEKTAEEKAAEASAARSENIKKAAEHFEKAVKLASDKKLDEAIKEYEESIKLNSDSAEAHSNLGFAYFDRFLAKNSKTDLEQSYSHQRKAVEINDKYRLAYYGMAQSLERAGNLPGALEAWKQFVKLSEPKDPWVKKADQHIKAIEKALKKASTQKKKGAGSAGQRSPH